MKNPAEELMKIPFSARFSAMALLVLCSGAATGALAAPAGETQTIRWTVAHARGESEYTGLMKEFARRIEQKSGGKLKVAFTDSDASEDAVTGAVHHQILEGRADISQINTLSFPALAAIQLPYVFRSHEHAETVFDGPVGMKLLSEVSAASENKLKALAFTYSGGYRVLLGKAAVRKAGDVKGLRFKGSSIASEFTSVLGAVPAASGDISSGKVDIVEVELSRIGSTLQAKPELAKHIKFISLTRHRMLVTTVIANEKFLAGLTAEQRKLLKDEVQILALAERKLSMDLEDRNLQLVAKNGTEILEIREAEQAGFEKAGESVRAKFPELAAQIAEIRAVKAKPSGRLASAN